VNDSGPQASAVSVPTPAADLHPSVTELLRYFEYTHLPDHLATVSFEFYILAHKLVSQRFELSGPELTTALRKLLESKDCAVRAAL
jgi:hypothetical protein